MLNNGSTAADHFPTVDTDGQKVKMHRGGDVLEHAADRPLRVVRHHEDEQPARRVRGGHALAVSPRPSLACVRTAVEEEPISTGAMGSNETRRRLARMVVRS